MNARIVSIATILALVATQLAPIASAVRAADGDRWDATAWAELRYEQRRISFGADTLTRTFTVDGVSQTVTGSELVPLYGSLRSALTWPSFYRTVGRADLASEYEKRESTKTLLLAGGLMLLAGGLGLAAVPLAKDMGDGKFAAFMASGSALWLFGVSIAVGGIYYDPQPVADSTIFDLADDYNRRLRRSLGAEGASSTRPQHHSSGLPQAWGASLRMEFD